MIRLAHPWALVLLASIPAILILYSLRPVRRRVQLSTVALWRQALREQRRGFGLQKLWRDLSLLLLLLCALALALGAAGPQWLTRGAEAGDAVLVLDVSASMQARSGGSTRFDEARRRAAELIDRLPEGGRLLIMTTGRHPVLRSAFEGDRDALRQVLDRLQPTDEAGRPRAALTLALSLLRNRERDRIYFLTDGAFDEAWDLDFEAAQIEYLRVGRPGRNVAITRFDFRREVGAEDRFEVFLAVRNYTDKEVGVPVTVTVGDHELAKRLLRLPANEMRALALPYRGRSPGLAQVQIDFADDLAADNRAYAALNLEEGLRVLLFTRGDFYLESVLSALPNVRLTRLDEVWPDSFAKQAQAHDLVVIDRVRAPNLPPGNYLLIDTVPPGLPFARRGAVAYPEVVGKGRSPLVQNLDLSGVKIDQASRVTTEDEFPGLQRLFWSAETDLGLALLQDGVRAVWLGFDLSRSNLPLLAAFPIFFQQSLAWLHPGGARFSATQVPAGETYSVPLPPGQQKLLVRTPANQRLRYPVSANPFPFDATSASGIYQYTAGRDRRYFAVNLTDARESDINPRTPPPARSAPTPPAETLSRVASPLWPLAAWAGLILLAGEWLLWCRGRSRA